LNITHPQSYEFGLKRAFIMIIVAGIMITVTRKSGNEQVDVPRFPHNTEKQTIRGMAVFYSPDDISANISLDELGYPDQYLFRLHKDHPQLKITMQTVPANRYIIEEARRNIMKITEGDSTNICCRTLWKMIMYDELLNSWMELGNHGYTHSPSGDSNLDHHEFSETQTGCNFNHSFASTFSYCDQRLKLARNSYKEIGLDNNKIIVMRFPGFAYTDAALKALLDNGFVAYFGIGECKAEWAQLSDGREILNIPSVILYDFYSGKDDNSYFQQCLENGGIINLFDHWWDMFDDAPRDTIDTNYRIASDVLTYIEQNFRDEVWWPFGSELALWLYFKENVDITLQRRGYNLELIADVTTWNVNWEEINASYTITLPANWEVIKIKYTLTDKRWIELGNSMYWKNDQTLYVNVPFRGHSRVMLTMSAIANP